MLFEMESIINSRLSCNYLSEKCQSTNLFRIIQKMIWHDLSMNLFFWLKDTWCSNLAKTTGIIFHLRVIWKSNVFFFLKSFDRFKKVIVHTSVEIFCLVSLWILSCNRKTSMEHVLISDHLICMEGWLRETKTIMVFKYSTRTRFL